AYTCINMAEELTGSEYGLIGEVNEAGRFDTISYGDLGWAICKIPESDAIALSKNMLIRGIWGQAILKGESQIVNDTTSHPESLGFPEGHPQIVNFMGVPLKDKGKTIGMIGLANKEGGYEPADQEAVEALSVAFVEALRRKRAEEALRASEEKYRTIVENSYDIIYSTDSDGKLIYVSPQVIHILGYRPDEMAGHYGVEFVHPDDVKKVMEDFERTIRTGEEFPSEFRFTTKDGSHVHVEEFGKIIRKGDKVAGITGIIRDITERKQAEEALRDSEATIRNIIELSNDAIYLLFEKKFVLINRKFSEMLGVTPDEVQTPEFNFMELIAPQSRSLVAERSRMRARGEEPPSQYEFTVLTRDGREIEVEASVKNIEYRGGMAVQGILRDITERKRAGEALRRSEHLFRQSIENSPNPVFSIDENGKILTWNPACEKVFQYEKEIIGQGFQILFDESVDCKYIESLVEQVFQRQEILSSLEMTFKCKDGSKRSMITRVYPISDKNGKVESCVFTNTDITERKRAEEALRQSEHLFRQSIENSPNPIFSIDENGKILTWNPACEKVFQYEKEIIGQGFQILFDESTDCKYFESLVEQVFQKQEILSSIEMSFKCKDGSNRFMITRVYPTLDINGKMESCVFTNTDITERMQSEMALKESEEKLSGIIKSIPDFISIIDEDYNIVWATDTVKNTVGQDVEKNKCYQAYHRSEAPCEDCIIRKVFADGETHEHEAETINAEGVSVFQLSVASAASRYPDGRPKTVIEISRDVTEFRKLQDQFRQAQKMEAIGRLAGGVAHDFNNLLTVIGGNTQLAMMALSEDDPLMHELNQVKKATQRASKLTYQLLAFSRKQVLKPEILSLNSLIADTKKMLHRVIGEDIELKTFLADDLWNVKADSGQFEQIVMNLCVNARDAMPDGGKLIVETENVNISEEYCADHPGAEPGSYVMLSVSDSGVGMTQSVKSQIFDPFYTTKAAGEGTGLGLSTVFGIVKQSGGFIYVYSELGEGTTIKIYLPSTEEEAKIVRKRVFTDEELRGKETILVVEDEEGVRNIAVMSLKKYGYRVIEAENGGAAYLKCKKAEQPMDLIVTDVVMPDMNGKELVESVREFWPDIKVLFMSGYTYNVIAKKGIIESEVSFLQKPFDPKDILQKVREAIDK
nr:PAS domain S-box protein [FCB group bacterium]